MKKVKIFLASSSELAKEREMFQIFISRKNNEWIDKGVFLQLIIWEDFLDALSKTRLQDEYNKAIKECDIFIMLFFTRVGKYTEEEFGVAIGKFMETNKPFIFTYFKDAEINISSINKNDFLSLLNFQDKLNKLGHFYTKFSNTEMLLLKFNQQLTKLEQTGFIKLDKTTINEAGDDHHAKMMVQGNDNNIIQDSPGSIMLKDFTAGRDISVKINDKTNNDKN
jgi:hypothetical protein